MSDSGKLTKREFLRVASVGAGALLGGPAFWRTALAAEPTAAGSIPYRTLGGTGEKVSLLGIGGYHMGSPNEEEGVRIVRTALDAGVNFLDNCWDYHGGLSEERMGRALRDGYREKAFLMSKIDGQTRKSAAAQIDESLKRLQTDRIDLMQCHEVIRQGDPARIFGPDGAMEALIEAKKSGKIRYIGFTGHKSPAMHLNMLKVAKAHDFHFDAVQMPLNVMDAHYDSFEKEVLPVLIKEKIGVLGMKPLCFGFILKGDLGLSPQECLRYAMSLPVSVMITGCDSMKILDQALGVARGFRPMSQGEVAALLQRTASLASNGEYERYKTSGMFDGTAQNPQWLG